MSSRGHWEKTPVIVWACDDCGFAYDAAHYIDVTDYSCPICHETALEQQLAEQTAAIAVLTDVLHRISADKDEQWHDWQDWADTALTPDLVAKAAEYREALAVVERVKEALLGQEVTPC